VNEKRHTTMSITVTLQNSRGESSSVGKKKEYKESELKKASAFSAEALKCFNMEEFKIFLDL